MRAIWMPCLLFGALAAPGCGGDDAPPAPEPPSSAEMRSFLGLNPGSCWTYQVDEQGVPTFATQSVIGPDSAVIAGETVYILDYVRAAGGGYKTYLDAETGGEVRILRYTENVGGENIDKRYQNDPAPLFAQLDFEEGEVAYPVNSYEETSTPKVPTAMSTFEDGAPEQHKWVVQGEEDVATHEGPATAIRLSYTREGQTALFWLVPGYGFARFTDFDNRTHDVCDARTCDASGNNCSREEACIATCTR